MIMSPSKTTSKTSILPLYAPLIPSVAPEPTLSNMLGSVMSAVGLQGPGSKARNVRRFPTGPIRRPYLVSDDQQGSEQEVEGSRGKVDTSANAFGAVQCMTDSTSMYPSPQDYQGPPTSRPTSIQPKLTVPPANSPSQGTPGPDARTRTATSIGGVITFAPDASQTVDESPKPPVTDSPPLPPNTVTAMFSTPIGLPTSQDTTEVIARRSTPSGDTSPPTSTYTRWENMTLSTVTTTTKTDTVDYVSIVTRRGDIVDMPGESEIRTCDTGPSVTSTIDPLPSTGFSDADDEVSDSDSDDLPAVEYFTNAPPETIFTLITSTETVTGPTAGAASPDSMWSVAVETGITLAATIVSPTQGAASPDSMWSIAAETGTVTETEIGLGGGMSTLAASTVFATPAVRANDVGVADTHMQAMGFMAGNIVALMAGLLMLGALKGVEKA